MSIEGKGINENTPVPLGWILKSLGIVVLATPIIWWAASLQTSMDTVLKQVEPIPKMAEDIARLKDKNGLSFQPVTSKSDISIVVKPVQPAQVPAKDEEVIKPANPQTQPQTTADMAFEVALIPKERLEALTRCRDLFGKGNAANSCVKLVMK